MDQLPAGQPVLGIPVDRERMAARAVSAAHRRDGLAGPPPRRLSRYYRNHFAQRWQGLPQYNIPGIGAAQLSLGRFKIRPCDLSSFLRDRRLVEFKTQLCEESLNRRPLSS
jgi:hypothetical protein